MSETLPPWVTQARQEFAGNWYTNDYGTLERARQSANILEQTTERIHVSNFALIGIGFDDIRVSQSITAPVLYSTLNAINDTPPLCTLLDNDPRIQAAFRQDRLYATPLTDKQKDDWDWFVQMTGQEEHIIQTIEPELLSDRHIDQHLEDQSVRAIDMPPVFAHNLHTRIQLIHADVSQSSWVTPHTFGFIDCSHVLQHLSVTSRYLALWNISRSLAPNGIAMFNDLSVKQHSEWLRPTYLQDMQLEDVSDGYSLPKSNIIVFQKA